MIREKIDKAMEWTLGAILSVMVIDVLWQVLSRYVFVNPSTFTDELASFLLIWLGVLGGAYVYGKNEHLSISFLVDKLSDNKKRAVKASVEIIVLLFSFCVMVVGGIWLVYTRFLLNVHSAALDLNWGYVYMVLPLSGLVISYYSIDNLLKGRSNFSQNHF
ncbi:MAG: TRAP transporter small permease [Rikenellaceae bacterium]